VGGRVPEAASMGVRRAVGLRPRVNYAGDGPQVAVRRRTDVVGISPGRDALIRLARAVLAEQYEWIGGLRYLGLDVLARPALPSSRPPRVKPDNGLRRSAPNQPKVTRQPRAGGVWEERCRP
jgi:hypothetical protein